MREVFIVSAKNTSRLRVKLVVCKEENMKRLFIISLLIFPSFLLAQVIETTETTTVTESRADVDSYMNAAKTDDIGLGVLVGGPTTLTGKYWLNESNAIDFGAAFAEDDYAIIATYLNHFESGAEGMGRRMAPYAGFGFYLDFNQEQNELVFDRDTNDREGSETDDVGFGIRIPLGLEYMPVEMPMGIFAEITPGLAITPDAESFVTVGAGARYYW
jgi:hypothetical protein